jgi:hypothetical protein
MLVDTIEQEKMLESFKAKYENLQRQISDSCLKSVIDSKAIKILRQERSNIESIIKDLSNKLTSDIIA